MLELFITTMIEYIRFANYLPLSNGDENLLDSSFDENTYIAVHVRLILLRKYTSKRDTMFFEELINESKKVFPQDSNALDNMKLRFQMINGQALEQILTDGTKLNLYESIEDVMYGLFLHADANRIARLSKSNIILRLYCTQKYVIAIEAIILELYSFLRERNVLEISETDHIRASIISVDANALSLQQVHNSPYWRNLYGHDMTADEIKAAFEDMSPEKKEVYFLAHSFLEELEKDEYSIESLRTMVYKSTQDDWGDFSAAATFVRKIQNRGTSTSVDFNEGKYAAYVKVLPHVDSGFVTNTPQVVADVKYITFYKGISDVNWKIFAFGAPVDPHEK